MSVTPLVTPESKGGDFELVPAGVYLARCYQMIDLGTQTDTSPKFGTTVARKIMLYWELLQDDDGKKVAMTDGRPFVISKMYTWSMHTKASLRKDLNNWRGVPFTDDEANKFEISKLLDKFCKLQIVHNASGDKTYANISGVMATKKTAEAVNSLQTFSIDNPDMQVFESLSEWLQNKIRAAQEWDKDKQAAELTGDSADVGIEDVDDKVDLSEVPFQKGTIRTEFCGTIVA